MMFPLSYLFYAGIIVPTVVTLALFVFFVICWRKQSARKTVLTKPYDPHGTMRRLGIPNRPPPPPVFIHSALNSPTMDNLGGEDNAAYDMSRSPSAEANAAGGAGAGGANHPGHHHHHPGYHPHMGPQHLNLQLQHLHHSLNAETYCCSNAAAAVAGQRLEFHTSPSGELDITGRLAFHSRLDSGLSEPACESPGACSHSAERGEAGGGGGGGSGAGGQRDRPQSQASHSSHSTDSEDSGFRSSRSGQFMQTAHSGPHNEQPVLKRSRSASRGKGRGFYHKAATSSPESDTEPSIQLTPTALWHHHNNHHHHHHPVPTHSHSNPHSPLHGDDTTVKNTGVDLNDIGTHIGWKYLQDLASPGRGPRDGSGSGGHGSQQGQRQTLTCHQSMTLAQVHTSHDLDNPDVFGFSVV